MRFSRVNAIPKTGTEQSSSGCLVTGQKHMPTLQLRPSLAGIKALDQAWASIRKCGLWICKKSKRGEVCSTGAGTRCRSFNRRASRNLGNTLFSTHFGCPADSHGIHAALSARVSSKRARGPHGEFKQWLEGTPSSCFPLLAARIRDEQLLFRSVFRGIVRAQFC